jgi:hypothetical protein
MLDAGSWKLGLVRSPSGLRHQRATSSGCVGFDDVIDPRHHDFASSGLKTASLIRLAFLAVLPEQWLFVRIASPFALSLKFGITRPRRHIRFDMTAVDVCRLPFF